MLKVLFVLKILTYLSWLFGYVKKRLDQNTNINFKIYDVTECIKKITVHVLPNIPGSQRQSMNEIWSVNRI